MVTKHTKPSMQTSRAECMKQKLYRISNVMLLHEGKHKSWLQDGWRQKSSFAKATGEVID